MSCDKILDTAEKEGCDVVGLSGLITPSLDEMVHVAKEMKRRGMKQPLLIGGATTSRQHTAVKIAPEYAESIVHVLDASRAVGVVSSLLDGKRREAFDAKNRDEQAGLRRLHSSKRIRELVPYDVCEANGPRVTWRDEDIAKPPFLGLKRLDAFPLGEIAKYIDWTFFFTAWELVGKFPAILDHPEQGAAARDLYATAQTLLKKIIDEKLLTANAVYGYFPAQGDGKDITLYADESRANVVARFPMLRQQQAKTDGKPFLSLADFVAPGSSGFADHIGAFAVTAGIGADALSRRFEAELDDYSAIIVKALADRLAEAFAEMLHMRVRREWYASDEKLTPDDLVAERYRGIRPAFGYPACPDHTAKGALFALLDAHESGIELTESYAMTPAASVSGIYLAHPEARYFNVGKIGRDQVADYVPRSGMTRAEVERWLSPNLGYDPAVADEAAA